MKVKFAMAAAAALVASGPAAPQSRPLGVAHQLTYSYNLDNSLSPDGRQMAFIRIIEGREQLFVMNSDGTGEKQITRDSADHEDPAWSPDGARSPSSWPAQEDRSRLNPTEAARGVTPPRRAQSIGWTPDSSGILYCTDDDLRPPVKNASEIHAIDLATRKVRTLIAGGVNTFPVMSPDGKRILFRRMLGEMNSEVFVAEADGSNPRNLTNHPSFEGWPSWSPDGRQIAFAGNRNANYQVFLMNADGSNVRLLANTEGRATVPRWSPDGRTIYFTNCQKRDFGSACEVMFAKWAGGDRFLSPCRRRRAATPLTAGPLQLSNPSRRTGNPPFFQQPNGRQAIWAAAGDGSNPRLLFDGAGLGEGRGTSGLVSDGSRIAFAMTSARRKDPNEIGRPTSCGPTGPRSGGSPMRPATIPTRTGRPTGGASISTPRARLRTSRPSGLASGSTSTPWPPTGATCGAIPTAGPSAPIRCRPRMGAESSTGGSSPSPA